MKKIENIINYILFYLKQLVTSNLIYFRRQPIYFLHYKNIPVGATTEEVEHIRKTMAYSNPEEVVKPMEHNADITENMEITNNTENTGDIATLLKQVGKPEQCEKDSKSGRRDKWKL